MGTIERGESNLSFANIARVAKTLGITLSSLFADLERNAEAAAGAKPAVARKRRKPGKQPSARAL
jgi:transcriptional regulator with XRE-family HTH domain